MSNLQKAARTAIKDCLKVQSGERLLVIMDDGTREIGRALFEAGMRAKAEAMLLEIVPRRTHGGEPPEPVAELMKSVDVVAAPTSKSLTHTQARREACDHGTRVATLPGITLDTMERALNVDYSRVAELSRKFADILAIGEHVHVTAPGGTDITMAIGKSKSIADTGLIHKAGQFGNLPAGEAFLAPEEGTAEGEIVIDASMAGVGLVKKPIKMLVKAGFVTRILGGSEAVRLRTIIKNLGKPARNIAELGIGTNHKAQVVGTILEDEKVAGTVHIAIGDNASMGGSVRVASHLDGLILRPTVTVDGKEILKNGVFVP